MSEGRKQYIRGFWKVDRVIAKVLKICSYIPAFLMFLVAIAATVNVILAKTINLTWPSLNDYVCYIFVLVVYMSVCHVQFESDFIYVDILSNRFPNWLNTVIGCVGDLIGAITFAYVARRMWSLMIEHFVYDKQTSSSIGHIPTWPFVLIFTVFAAVLSFTFLWNLLRRGIYHGAKRFDEQVLLEAGVPQTSINAARLVSSDDETGRATEEEYERLMKKERGGN